MAPKTILVIDDDKSSVKNISRILRDAGYCIMTAKSGEDGIELAKFKSPDLILVDILMTEMNGFVTFGKLKDWPGTKNIPVIFVSALDGESIRTTAYEMGARDYLCKPIDREVLISRIKREFQDSDASFVQG